MLHAIGIDILTNKRESCDRETARGGGRPQNADPVTQHLKFQPSR
jgi:hypothetical protein